MIIKNVLRRSFIYVALVMAMVMPISQDVNANSSLDMGEYQAYPIPLLKPLDCISNTEVMHENYIGKKQAAAAALGLYLGIKQATAPQTTSEEKQNLCA